MAALVLAGALMSGVAVADAIQGSSGVLYVVPASEGGWPQKRAGEGNKIVVFEEPGHSPAELSGVEFPALTGGTIEHIETRLPAEFLTAGITFFGTKASTTTLNNDGKTSVVKAPTKNGEMYRDVNVRTGTATINGLAARYVLTQVPAGKFGTVTSVVVIVAAKGSEKRVSVVDEILNQTKYMKRNGETDVPTPAQPELEEKPYVPTLSPVAFVKDVTATSTFADKKNMYAPWRVIDWMDGAEQPGDLPRPTTAWCEGKPDEGVGEGVTIVLASPTKVDKIQIAGGVWLTEKLFKGNNYVKSVAISFDGAAAKKVALPNERAWVDVKVGKAISKIEIKLDAVTKGKMNDSCISGITLHKGDDQLSILRGLDPAAAAALQKGIIAIYDALAQPKKLEPLLWFPLSVEDSSMWGFGNAPVFTHKNFKSVEAACRSERTIKTGWPEGTPRTCPHGPNTRDDYGPRVSGSGTNVQVTFPSGREIADAWDLVWQGGVWKLTSVGFGAP